LVPEATITAERGILGGLDDLRVRRDAGELPASRRCAA
jgi:hypothetical protein